MKTGDSTIVSLPVSKNLDYLNHSRASLVIIYRQLTLETRSYSGDMLWYEVMEE